MNRVLCIAFVFLLSCLSCVCLFAVSEDQLVHGVNQIYEKIASPDKLRHITQLFQDLQKATPCQLYSITQEVIELLRAKDAALIKFIEECDEHEQCAGFGNLCTHFYFQKQLKHLQEYKTTLFNTMSWSDKLKCSFKNNVKSIGSWIRDDKFWHMGSGWEEGVADNIIVYIDFEREAILFNKENLLTFLSYDESNILPPLVNFWLHDASLRKQLILRARSFSPEVRVQFLEEVFMFALQSYLLAGGSMYSQWLDEQDAEIFKAETAKQNAIQTKFEVYMAKLQEAQKNIIHTIITSFQRSVADLSKKYDLVNKQQQQEQLYLFKSINLDYPIQHALVATPAPYDQMFAASIMNTPVRQPWYNIYQIGDWQFDPLSNSFSQNQLVPFGTPFWVKSGEDDSYTDPSQNNIFTEYISNDASYTIQVECTILNCAYPFFAGIMFNRARWIAADPEKIWQYRLVGLYGKESKPGDESTRSIELAFAQQILSIQDNKETITSPLEQIVTSAHKTSLYSIPKSDIEKLKKDPITYIFTITIDQPRDLKSLSTVTLQLARKGEQPLFSTTLNNLNNYLAIYNGIGFMAPNCQINCKIIKPEKLIYSPDDLKAMK